MNQKIKNNLPRIKDLQKNIKIEDQDDQDQIHLNIKKEINNLVEGISIVIKINKNLKIKGKYLDQDPDPIQKINIIIEIKMIEII